MAGCWTHCLRPAVALNKTLMGIPALQRAFINSGEVTGQTQPGASLVSRVDVMCQATAIFDEDHSSSPLLKIAVIFFDRTSKAAVSAKERSLRSSSRSSSLMRVLSLRVACGLALASCGSQSAAAALVHHFSNSAGRCLARGTGASANLRHRSRGDHGLKPSRRSPCPCSGGHGLNIFTPAL